MHRVGAYRDTNKPAGAVLPCNFEMELTYDMNVVGNHSNMSTFDTCKSNTEYGCSFIQIKEGVVNY